MSSTITTTAENNSLFEIDKELETAFDAASEEQERTGTLTEETRQRCLELFAQLGKKVDRIANYVRIMEWKARAAKEESSRLAARQKAAENRIDQIKDMLSYFMQSRGLKRLEGELNSIRLQKNGQASLQLDPLALPCSYSRRELKLMHEQWLLLLDSIASEDVKGVLESAVSSVEPSRELIRKCLEEGEDVPGARLVKGQHIRFE
jgi:hypothetical protein